MGPQTLADIIDNINPKRLHSSSSLRKHSSSSTHTQDEDPLQHIEEHKTSTIARGWTAQEDLIFERLIDNYGADFTIVQGYLPQRSRKQIKKRFDKIQGERERRLIALQRLRRDKARKNIFEEDILEVASSECIEYPNKPPSYR